MNNFLKIGDVITLNSEHVVYADIPEHFVFTNRKGSFALVNSNVRLSGEFDYLRGDYVVVAADMRGGSSGHDPHPNGWFVQCESINTGVKVSFYQSGCFNATIADIKPKGRAELKWVFTSDTGAG